MSFEISHYKTMTAVQGSKQFTVVATDRYGNIAPGIIACKFGSEGGSKDTEGAFRAGIVVDIFTVLARIESGGPSAAASVTVEPRPQKTLILEPARITLEVGAEYSFTFNAVDSFGNRIEDLVYSWLAPSDIGVIDAEGHFRAGTEAGTYQDTVGLTVASRTGKGISTANETILPDSFIRIVVSPSTADPQWRAGQRFVAEGLDRYGNPVLGLAFVWEASGGTVDHSGELVAVMQIGTYSVSALAFSGSEASVSGEIRVIAPKFSLKKIWGKPLPAELLNGPNGVALDSFGDVCSMSVLHELTFSLTNWLPTKL